MAGNIVSIMAITTKGRGGRRPETLPKSNKGFTIQEKQNSRFRCANCKTILPNNYYGYEECPFCHSKNSIITIMGREIRTKISHENMIHNIKKKIRSNPNLYSKKELAIEFNVSYPTMLLLCRSLSIEDAKLLCDRRGKKKAVSDDFCDKTSICEEAIIEEDVSVDCSESVDNEEVCRDNKIPEEAQIAFDLKSEGYKVEDIPALLFVATSTVYKYISQIKNLQH